jgi:hypothetical protein
MTDDIVTRLREHALEGIWDFTKCSWDMQEAADEIERLRQLLWKYENCEMVTEVPCNPDWVGGECDICKGHHRD